jgi:hypothetical protein
MSSRLELRLTEQGEADLAACLVLLARERPGEPLTKTDAVHEALRRMAKRARALETGGSNP